MRKKILLLIFILMLLCLFFVSTFGRGILIKKGQSGGLVYEAQKNLVLLGYMNTYPTSFFGNETLEAIVNFQKDLGVIPDGIIGNQTWEALHYKALAFPKTGYVFQAGDTIEALADRISVHPLILRLLNGLSQARQPELNTSIYLPKKSMLSSRAFGNIVLMPWPEANKFFPVGDFAQLYDVETGVCIQIKRMGGYNHADIEPLTIADTIALKKIYGGHWSWSRRAVLVEYNDQIIAASINGMPHGHETIYYNNMRGQICLHFKDSRTHAGNRLDPDHQAMILKAAEFRQ